MFDLGKAEFLGSGERFAEQLAGALDVAGLTARQE
jgi:hypothetical protein